MKANASQGGGNAKKKKSLYGKTVPVTSVGGGRTKMPTKKQAAATRSMVGNAALMVVPGGAVVKGATTASKVLRAGKSIEKLRNPLPMAVQREIKSKAISSTRALTKRTDVQIKGKPIKIDSAKNVKRKAMTQNMKDSFSSAKQVEKNVKQSNKSTLKKLKSSGAIKRMK